MHLWPGWDECQWGVEDSSTSTRSVTMADETWEGEDSMSNTKGGVCDSQASGAYRRRARRRTWQGRQFRRGLERAVKWTARASVCGGRVSFKCASVVTEGAECAQ